MDKRGQAIIEFFLTYGWAILAAVIAIGVLAYFGVFSPGNQTEESYNKYCSTFCEHYNMTCDNDYWDYVYCYKLVNDTIIEKREIDTINGVYVFLENGN